MDTKYQAGSKVCIVCYKQLTAGLAAPVKDDVVIGFIRAIKKTLNIAQNNELFVCEKDLNAQKERRKKFERDMVIISGLTIIMLVLLTVIPLTNGRFDIVVFISAIFIALLLILFGVVFRHTPEVGEVMDIGPPSKQLDIKNEKTKSKIKKLKK